MGTTVSRTFAAVAGNWRATAGTWLMVKQNCWLGEGGVRQACFLSHAFAILCGGSGTKPYDKSKRTCVNKPCCNMSSLD